MDSPLDQAAVMRAHRSAYIYHPYSRSEDGSIGPMDEIVILPTHSSEKDALRLSSVSLASHDFFFDSTRSSPIPNDEHDNLISTRFVPSDIDFFANQEKFRDPFNTREELYQERTASNHSGDDEVEPYSFLSDFDSDSEFEMDDDIRSASPSICATARKVKITPLRAVRRSVRRSSFPEAQRVRTSTFGDFSFTQHAPNTYSPARSLAHKLSIDNLKRMISPWRASETVDPVTPSPVLSTASSERSSFSRTLGDITVIELHDVTQEAIQLAAMMSSRWKFEPVVELPVQQEGKSTATRLTPGFFRRRSC
ncbi:hypothetical protein BDN70DRAFT_931808 [Pholiota conissans]|uniref:Uncharacterized protein n=1 Tax=Pholiota conissans TaxID=109636 RepID=A0A9P6D1F8_9AGAR|nr:hypothetical protein BDN70DRAFT_931808 [Pholiota conissans]